MAINEGGLYTSAYPLILHTFILLHCYTMEYNGGKIIYIMYI